MTDPRPVLIVEDDWALAEALGEVLRDEGYTTAWAADGVDALAWLADHRPRAILLDLMMPRMNGYQFIDEWKKNPTSREVATIVLTASTSVRPLPLANATVIHKPVDVAQLLDALARACA